MFGPRHISVTPPPSVREPNSGPSAPPTFAYVLRREPHAGISFMAAPASQYDEYLDIDPNSLGVSAYQEAPDPIRQSEYWPAGRKIHPWAHNLTPSHLAIGSKEAVMLDDFHVGKLVGYIRPGQTTFVGGQLPLVQRANIQPAISTTYGSQYEVQGIPDPGPIILATGMSYFPDSAMDGYPY